MKRLSNDVTTSEKLFGASRTSRNQIPREIYLQESQQQPVMKAETIIPGEGGNFEFKGTKTRGRYEAPVGVSLSFPIIRKVDRFWILLIKCEYELTGSK